MLNLIYNTKDEIPAGYEALYTERDGKWVLTGVNGMKTQADIDRVNEALRKERNDHKTTKDELAKYDGLNADEIHDKLAKIPELEARAGQVDESKFNEAVEARIKVRLAPVERERDSFKKKATDAEAKVGELEGTINKTHIEGAVRDAATKAGVVGTALDDILLLAQSQFTLTDDGKIVTKDTSLPPEIWMGDMKEKRPHWWATSQGGGATGGKGANNFPNNPFTAENWNMTEQGKVVNTKGMEFAKQLAQAAGTTVGGPKPAAK